MPVAPVSGWRSLGAAAALAVLWLAALPAYLILNVLLPLSPRALASEPAARLIDDLPLWRALAALPLPGSDTAQTVAVLGALVLPPAAYALALYVARRAPRARAAAGVVFVGAVLFWLTSALAPPTASGDLFLYLALARVANVYHANPYAVAPAAFAGDPYLPYVDKLWASLPTPYGPTWTYLSVAWGRLLGDDIARNVVGFRLLLLGCNVISAVLLWRILGRLRPDARLAGLVFFAWNPIIVLKGQSHTEAVMVVFLIAGANLYTSGRSIAALPVLTLSALTKFITAPVLPVAWAFTWRRRGALAALAGALFGAGLSVLLFLPVWDGWSMAGRLLRDPWSPEPGGLLASRSLLRMVPVVAVALWAGLRGAPDVASLLDDWVAVLLAFLMLMAPLGLPYYLVTLVGAASLARSHGLTAAALALCAGAWIDHLLVNIGLPIAPSWVAIAAPSFRSRIGWMVLPLLALAWAHRDRIEWLVTDLRGAIRWRRPAVPPEQTPTPP
jgi:hypothetical protein